MVSTRFMNLLENAVEVPAPSKRMAGVIAGTWFIPGIGQVVAWFSTQQEIKNTQSKIPSRLKDSKGNVDLGKFNRKSLFRWEWEGGR